MEIDFKDWKLIVCTRLHQMKQDLFYAFIFTSYTHSVSSLSLSLSLKLTIENNEFLWLCIFYDSILSQRNVF